MKYSSVWFVALSLVVSLVPPGQAAAQVSIMPVGDSITQGIGGECSYRRPLSQALIENACNVNFVGSRITAGNGGTANTPPITVCAPQNTDHQAISGFRADQILTNNLYNFTNELNSRQPDIVLLHVGSNDIFQNQSVSSTVNDVDEIIDRVLSQRPTATVVVADVIPWSEESVNPSIFPSIVNANRDMLADTALLSAGIKTLVNNRASSGDAVRLVEVKDGFENDLMAFDGVHPNPVGEAHIANRMLSTLYDLGVCNNQADVQPPITYISTPSEEDEQLSVSPTLSGTAIDEGGSGINRVRIAIQNSAGLWLNYASGTFSSTFDSNIVATMSNTTTSSTSWSITTDLVAGDYRLYALALDNNNNQVEESAGNGQPNSNQKVWTTRAFEVVNSQNGEPPEFTTPPVGASLNAGSTTFTWEDNGTSVTEWWLYAGNAQSGAGQYLYDRGGSLPANTRSAVVTGLPGDGSTVYVTLWYKPVNSGWKFVISEYTADDSGGVEVSSPVDGSTLSSAVETFTFASNGVAVDEYWLYVGSGVNKFDYYNSGSITGTSTQVSRLPTNGETVYVRLWHRETGGPWQSVDSTYTAATLATPEMSSPANGSAISASQAFTWTANGTNVGEWWLYAGSAPGGANIYNSGTLGASTSDTISGLPSGPVYVTLWFRATGGAWQSVRYSYTVQ